MSDGDRKIECSDCRAWFEFTVGEQKFFEKQGFKPPKRCKECRAAKKKANESRGMSSGQG
ncbi:MAG: zinc-ribbon domain containing protein [Vicinamibacteria bacterium]